MIVWMIILMMLRKKCILVIQLTVLLLLQQQQVFKTNNLTSLSLTIIELQNKSCEMGISSVAET